MLIQRNDKYYCFYNKNDYLEYTSKVKNEKLRLLTPKGQLEILENGENIPELTDLERQLMIEVAKSNINLNVACDVEFFDAVMLLYDQLVDKGILVEYLGVCNSGMQKYNDAVSRGLVNLKFFDELFEQYSAKMCEETILKERLIKCGSELTNFGYDDLKYIWGRIFASRLRNKAHDQGICLKNEIPEDLIPIEKVRNKGLGGRACNRFLLNGISSVGDMITYENEDVAREEFFQFDGFGEVCWKNVIKFMSDSGYTFASREVKVEEYQKKLGNIK